MRRNGWITRQCCGSLSRDRTGGMVGRAREGDTYMERRNLQQVTCNRLLTISQSNWRVSGTLSTGRGTAGDESV
jgi:hypothetical protein